LAGTPSEFDGKSWSVPDGDITQLLSPPSLLRPLDQKVSNSRVQFAEIASIATLLPRSLNINDVFRIVISTMLDRSWSGVGFSRFRGRYEYNPAVFAELPQNNC
jgi:hypothetical protein